MMLGPLYNAKDKNLFQNTGTLPDMSSAILNYFQPMTFVRLVQEIVNFQVVDTPKKIQTEGVIQPFTPRQLTMRPEGQRAWSWFTVHALPNLVLKPNEVISYNSIQYRVKSQTDYTIYGYVEYQIILDYKGAGP